jgi:hypothetical protein
VSRFAHGWLGEKAPLNGARCVNVGNFPAISNHGAEGSYCEGFRMSAARKIGGGIRRPASENLQGRKPREKNWNAAACAMGI